MLPVVWQRQWAAALVAEREHKRVEPADSIRPAATVEAGAAGRGEAVGLHGFDLAVGLLPVVAAAGSPQGDVLATKGSGNARHRRCQSKKM